jgi:integrase
LVTELGILWKKSDKNLDALVFGIKDNVRKAFSTACRIAGIEEGGIDGFSLHSCRHTAAIV